MATERKAALKARAVDEARMYWVFFLYFAFVLSALIMYRRLTVNSVAVTHLHYGYALIEAAILGKVILIGRAFGLGRRVETGHRLIEIVLLKAGLYAVLLGLFGIVEHLVHGLLHHESLQTIASNLAAVGPNAILGRVLVVLVVFVPFFALLEACRVLGNRDLYALFFDRRMADVHAS
jgi:hypothetical protein